MEADKITADPNDATADSDAAGGGVDATVRQEGKGDAVPDMPPEINGPKGPEPTRYGDWEQKGRCSDF